MVYGIIYAYGFSCFGIDWTNTRIDQNDIQKNSKRQNMGIFLLMLSELNTIHAIFVTCMRCADFVLVVLCKTNCLILAFNDYIVN